MVDYNGSSDEFLPSDVDPVSNHTIDSVNSDGSIDTLEPLPGGGLR